MYLDGFSSPENAASEGLFQPLRDAGERMLVSRGQMIYLQGQEAKYLYCLCEGRVRVMILSDEGEERMLATYHPGAVFGEASFFDRMPRVSTAFAEEDCEISRLGHEQVSRLLREDPDLADAMIAYLARTVRLLSSHVDTMSFQSAELRLRNLLYHGADGAGNVSLSHEALASALGVSRVTVSRILSGLARQGIIETGYRRIHLLQPGLLLPESSRGE